jgi:phosphatidylglycerophosphate synthase
MASYDLNEIQDLILDSDYELIPHNIQITEEAPRIEIKRNQEVNSNVNEKEKSDDNKKIDGNKKYSSVDSISNYSDNEQKYGNDEAFESWADNKIFFPLGDKLVNPIHEIGLTPNQVTYLGTFCTLLAVYYVYIDEHYYAVIAYTIGYVLDCVDGRLARKFNMSSKEGMILDLTSDYLSNLLLMMVIVYKHGYGHWFVWAILVMTSMISLSYGINEAIASKKQTGSDNFILRRKEQIGETSNILDNLFLLIIGISYSSYRTFFPSWDEEKINKWLPILKEFGPGNYNLLMIYILLNLPKAIN